MRHCGKAVSGGVVFLCLLPTLLAACVSPAQQKEIDHNTATSRPAAGQAQRVQPSAAGTLAVIGLTDLHNEDIPWAGGKVEGLLVGSLAGCYYGVQFSLYNPVACLPGAAVGAVAGLVGSADSEEIAAGRAAVLDAIAESDFHQKLLSGVRAEAATQEKVQVVPPESHEGLFSDSDNGTWLSENCQALSQRGIDILLLMDRTTLALASGKDRHGAAGVHLVVTTRARLFDTRSGALLQELEFFLPGKEYGDRHDWVEWDAQMMKEELAFILDYAPLFIVDELVGAPPPLLQQWQLVEPGSRVQFSWQPPADHPFYAGPVTYELIVFTPQQVPEEHPCGRSCLLEKAAEWDYRRDGIEGRALVVEPSWSMSQRHFWSVRAAHVDGDRVWYTRWAKPRRIWR